MSLALKQSFEIPDRISKTSQGWRTRDSDIPTNTYTIGSSIEILIIDNSVAQEVAQLRIEFSLVIKQFKAVRSQEVNMLVYKVKQLGTMTLIHRRIQNIQIIKFWVSRPKVKGLVKTTSTLVWKIKVRTIIRITTTTTFGIEIGVKGEIVIKRKRKIIKITKVVFIFR